MRALKAPAILTALLILGSLGMGCDNKLSCKTAMRNFYSGGCVMVIYNPDQQYLTQSEARDWCESAETRAADCQCEDEHLALIDCAFMTDTGACYDCNDQLAELQDCLNTCVL